MNTFYLQTKKPNCWKIIQINSTWCNLCDNNEPKKTGSHSLDGKL